MADIIVPSDFETIQEAVINSCPGDTISVLPGNYEEQVIISVEDITIAGAAVVGSNLRGSNSNDIGLMILSDGVQIENLNIGMYNIGIYVNGSDCIIDGVQCVDCKGYGIIISGSNNLIENSAVNLAGLYGLGIGGDGHNIENCLFTNNSFGGISNQFEELTNSKFSNNVIAMSPLGISISNNGSHCNEIKQNAFASNTGIFLSSPFTRVEKNTFQNCVDAGIIVDSKNNEVNNNIITNTRNGIIVTDRCNKFNRQMISNAKESAASFADGDNTFNSSIISDSTIGIRSVDNSNVFQNNVFVNVQRESVLVQ